MVDKDSIESSHCEKSELGGSYGRVFHSARMALRAGSGNMESVINLHVES